MRAMRTHTHLALFLVACLSGSPGWAQSTLDGNWRVTFATEGAEGREAKVELKDGAGTWTTYARTDRDKKDACVGRPLPVSLAGDPAAGKFELRLDAASVVADCRNRKATLRRTDDQTLEGAFDNGRAIKLVRQ